MNKLTAFLVSALLVSTSAHAGPASEESIDALLVATKAESLVDGMYANVEQFMRQATAAATQGKPVSEEQQRVLDAIPAKFSKVMREEMSWANMRPLYVQIYQESFSQEEIDALIAFYQSPAGQAFVAKMPVVMQKSMNIMQSRIGPLMEKMQAAMQEAVAEAKLSR
jgi:uncharacterized protein